MRSTPIEISGHDQLMELYILQSQSPMMSTGNLANTKV